MIPEFRRLRGCSLWRSIDGGGRIELGGFPGWESVGDPSKGAKIELLVHNVVAPMSSSETIKEGNDVGRV